MDFDSMSIKELRTYAKEHGIKLQSATKKADILDIVKTNAEAGIEEDYDDLLAAVRGAEDSRENVVRRIRRSNQLLNA